MDSSPHSRDFSWQWSSILKTCPSQCRYILRSLASMLVTVLHTGMHMAMCMYVCIYVCMHVGRQAWHICVCKYITTCYKNKYVCTHLCVCLYTYAYLCMYACIYVICVFKPPAARERTETSSRSPLPV